MIYGIGSDVVEYERIESMWIQYGMRFARRILSESELVGFTTGPHSGRFLAKRFAAKEAFSKAIGSGLREPVTLPRISIVHDEYGKPILQFDEVLESHLAKLGISAHHISISDEKNIIIAFAVLETN